MGNVREVGGADMNEIDTLLNILRFQPMTALLAEASHGQLQELLKAVPRLESQVAREVHQRIRQENSNA